MDAGPLGPSTYLSWPNVSLAFGFIIFNSVISWTFALGVGASLITAAVRCVVQLTLVATILSKVFETDNGWAIAGIAFLLNFMGTIEAVVNKAKKRYQYMFPSVLVAMLGSTIPVAVLGIRFAMSVNPFWKPDQFIPVVGMLCGSTISGIVVAVGYVLKELYDNKDKVETYLAFGASRFEACRPIAREALRLSLTPNINQMSVLGIIAIPGMMTGAILGGSSVEQAARLQMVIMFMISASTALASIVTTVHCLSVVVDSEHRIRADRIDGRLHAVWRGRNWIMSRTVDLALIVWEQARGRFKKQTKYPEDALSEDHERLLNTPMTPMTPYSPFSRR